MTGALLIRGAVALTLASVVAGGAGAMPTSSAEIIFSSRGPYGDIVSVPLDGSPLRNLTPGTDTSTEFHPSWSPDGTRILYASARSSGEPVDIYIADADGSHRQLVTTVAGSDARPVWAPDGSRIAYVNTSAPTDVYVATLGGEVTRLTTDGSLKLGPIWSPDGTEIMYGRQAPPDGVWALFAVPASGGAPRELATQASAIGAWSPDGTRIAFVRHSPEEPFRPALYVVGRDGAGLRRVSTTPPAASAVSWSPNGAQVAFTSAELVAFSARFGPGYDYEIAVVNADGSGERKLTRTSSAIFNGEPRWSPDGSRIAFQTSRDGEGRIELYTVNADGSCETRLTSFASQHQATEPAWRPGTTAPELRCADLELSSIHAPDVVAALRQRASLEFKIVNSGNEAAPDVRFQLSDLPAGLTLHSLTPTRGNCEGLSCALGALASGSGAAVTAVVSSSQAFNGALDGTAATTTGLDGDQHDNKFRFVINVLPCTIVGTDDRDIVKGTPGADRICALPGPDVIHGLGGNDTIDAGNGEDRVWPGRGRDTVELRGGVDLVDARDAEHDTISCGGEADVALIDRFDKVDKTCEAASRTTLRCTTIGSFRTNKIVGSARRDSICAFGGNDTVDAGIRNDQIDGGTGNDTLTGGPGRDLILAGGGNDLIKLRDGSRDIVHCGSEVDLVFADRLDVADSDCEQVRRR